MNLKQIKELAGHRTVSPWIVKLVQDAIAVEREACAKVCDEQVEGINTFAGCTEAIRARGTE